MAERETGFFLSPIAPLAPLAPLAPFPVIVSYLFWVFGLSWFRAPKWATAALCVLPALTPRSLTSVRLRKSRLSITEFEIPCTNRVLRGKLKYPPRRSSNEKFKRELWREWPSLAGRGGTGRMTKMTKTMQSVPKKSSGIGLVLHEKGSGPVDLAVKVGPQVHCGGGERERERRRRRRWRQDSSCVRTPSLKRRDRGFRWGRALEFS